MFSVNFFLFEEDACHDPVLLLASCRLFEFPAGLHAYRPQRHAFHDGLFVLQHSESFSLSLLLRAVSQGQWCVDMRPVCVSNTFLVQKLLFFFFFHSFGNVFSPIFVRALLSVNKVVSTEEHATVTL